VLLDAVGDTVPPHCLLSDVKASHDT
jgi:hypothetical protein